MSSLSDPGSSELALVQPPHPKFTSTLNLAPQTLYAMSRGRRHPPSRKRAPPVSEVPPKLMQRMHQLVALVVLCVGMSEAISEGRGQHLSLEPRVVPCLSIRHLSEHGSDFQRVNLPSFPSQGQTLSTLMGLRKPVLPFPPSLCPLEPHRARTTCFSKQREVLFLLLPKPDISVWLDPDSHQSLTALIRGRLWLISRNQWLTRP